MDATTLTLPQLAEAYGVKSRELAAIWDKGGADLNLTADEVEQVRTLSDELSRIKDAEKAKRALAEQKAAFDIEQSARQQPASQHTHPAAGAQQSVATERKSFKSIGQMAVESAMFKEFSASRKMSPEVEFDIDLTAHFRALEQAQKTLLTTAEYPSTDFRLPGLTVAWPRIRPTVADLIPQGTTSAQVVSYVAELEGTNAAAAVAEGAPKPESALDFEERTANVRKVATWIPVTDELMEDEPGLRTIIDSRLRLFLQLEEERLLVDGSGVAPEFFGLMNTAGIQTQAKGTDPTPDAIYKAMVKILLASKFQADGIIMHPNDWTDIRLLRTPDGVYIWGSPAEVNNVERIWGLPVVTTESAEENTAIVAAFQPATQIFRRNGVSMSVSDQHSDFWVRNQMAIRIEERLAFVVFRPNAVCTVTGI